ncbi:CocE/NonD family hydrolase [Streptomyces canus]|uniref:CocE/NonD family hydrolase n=1 Tax=Streptomyces canus TaxID=58343 RepID=UPI0022524B80|nr:CocE/NonD family hydrolase [Streptomyces canus]MCX4853640.1 CocE/NonD family hydrolase [Streptomyces canus]
MPEVDDEWQRVPLPGGRTCWRRTLRTTVRDGIQLVADVYADRPDPGPGPVILERTPYGRRAARTSDGALSGENPPTPETVAEVFTRGGYRIVRQDCRGRGDSEGTFVKYLNEATDGYDTVEWIAEQPWCDGRVATMGVSYSAHAQAALASLGAPHLAAMFLDSGGFASAYEAGTRMGGAFELKQATWAFHRAKVSETVRTDPVLRASFLAGHRLRLDVSSSNFPRFDVNSNTGGTEVGDRRKVVATNRVHTGGRSWLTVSVLRPKPEGRPA